MFELNKTQLAAMISAAQTATIVQGYNGKSVAIAIDLRDCSILDSLPANSKIPVLTINSHRVSEGLAVSFRYSVLSSDGTSLVCSTSEVYSSYSEGLSYPGRATDKTLLANLLDALITQGEAIIARACRQHAAEIADLGLKLGAI